MGLEEDVGPFRQKISMATATDMHANSKFDNENVEDLLTCKAGLKADRPQSSGSAGSGSANRAPAKIEGSFASARGGSHE